MSRTDVHRPWRVQIADPHNRHLLYRHQAWPWQTELTFFKNMCGCKMCTGHDWRRQERRRNRREAKRALRQGREPAPITPLW